MSKNKNPYITLKKLVCTFLLFAGILAEGQNITETRWFFGNSIYNLVFDGNGRDVSLDSVQSLDYTGISGGMTITDQFTGNLLFYSDGSIVFDAMHIPTSDGAILNALTNVNVPILVAPRMGFNGQYNLFTNSGTEISLSRVDASQIGNGSSRFPLGEVILSNQPLATSSSDPSEGMIMIPSGNDGTEFYLITQNRNTFEFNIMQTGNGFGLNFDFDFTDIENPGFEASHFAFNADSSLLAVAPKTANRNIWLLEFDAENFSQPTDFEFQRAISNTGFDDGFNESVYDIEWSSNGSKLYFSRYGGDNADLVGQLYQVDLGDSLLRVNEVLDAPVYRSLGLKRGIDDRIYHLYQAENENDPILLGRINRPDSLVDSVLYQQAIFDVDFNGTQFPEFTPGFRYSYDQEGDSLGFTVLANCDSSVSTFFPIISPTPNRIFWDFGDGSGEVEAIIANHTYETPGTYTVRMFAELNGVRHQVDSALQILDNQLNPDLGNDTTICGILVLDPFGGQEVDVSNLEFVWNTTETSATIEVDTTGTFWVSITDASTGCQTYDEIEVLYYGDTESTSNQWYFGERAGIEFTNGPIAILDGNQQSAPEGCATITDINGDLLFYTNGATIWNRDHEVMVNGENIGGDLRSAQNSIIMPFNNDRTMYYLLTTDEVYGDDDYALRYTIVDMKRDEGRGAVVSLDSFDIKNLKILDNSTERITASGFSGNDLIVSHDFGNNTFRSYNTNVTGLTGPTYSPTGLVHEFTDSLNGTGYMKVAPSQDLVAVNVPGNNAVEIFDLVAGVISNPRTIDTGEEELYGLEFSNASSKLYLTRTGDNSKLIQYSLDSLNSENPVDDISGTKFEFLAGDSETFGALQMGPNGIIYMAVDNATDLGTISSPEGDTTGASFTSAGFNLQGRTSRLGLPNFAQNQSPPQQNPAMTIVPGCAGEETTFSATGRDPNNSIENYTWIFGDGQSAIAQDTTHIYSLPGTYTVQLRLENICDTLLVLTQDITIDTLPISPFNQSLAICDGPIQVRAVPDSVIATVSDTTTLIYNWSNGDTTRVITVSEPARLFVSISDINGCSSSTAEVFIADLRPEINLGGDLVLCQNDDPVLLDSDIPLAAQYQWFINGIDQNADTRTFEVNTSNTGEFEYVVQVLSTFGCVGGDTIQVSVGVEPQIAFPTTNSECGNSTGTITFDFIDNSSYIYSLSGPVSSSQLSSDGVDTTFSNLPAGSYTASIRNLVSGCQLNQNIQVNDDNTFDMDVSGTNGCLGQGAINLSFNNFIPSRFSVQVDDTNGNAIFNGEDVSVIQDLDTGLFTVIVTDLNAGCIESETVSLDLLNPQPAFTFDAIQEFCDATGQLTINNQETNPVSFLWSGPGIVGDNDLETITINESGTYTVTVSGTNFCPRTESIEAIVNDNALALEILTTGEACDGELILSADVSGGSGNFLFEWDNDPLLRVPQITVNESGNYSVNIIDQQTGCDISGSIEVQVFDEFTLFMSLEPDCANNGLVFITATTNFYDSTATYVWLDPEGFELPDRDSTAVAAQSGRYTVTVTNGTGDCTVSGQIDVAIVPIFPEDILLESRETFCLNNPNNPIATLDPGIFNTYEWRLAGDPTILSTNQVYETDVAGTYEVTLYNGFTCTIARVEVVEDCRPVIFAPNAFSPNGNGANDEFFVYPSEFVNEFQILIYTRWGELVYQSNNQDFRWNGVYKGRLLPPGTYAYLMKFSSSIAPELGTIEQYGSITLVR